LESSGKVKYVPLASMASSCRYSPRNVSSPISSSSRIGRSLNTRSIMFSRNVCCLSHLRFTGRLLTRRFNVPVPVGVVYDLGPKLLPGLLPQRGSRVQEVGGREVADLLGGQPVLEQVRIHDQGAEPVGSHAAGQDLDALVVQVRVELGQGVVPVV